jgi:hypothetical protein
MSSNYKDRYKAKIKKMTINNKILFHVKIFLPREQELTCGMMPVVVNVNTYMNG